MFEKGAALNALGRPEEAIPILEQRLNDYGDNERGEVQRELATRARRPARATKAIGRRADVRRAWPPPRSLPPTLAFPKPRLLCVDDEPIVLESLRDVAAALASTSAPPRSGPEALALLRREPRGYAVVL